MIPAVLNNDNIKFCKVKKGTKKPYELDWPNKPYSYQEMEEWLSKNDENYGVLCGYGDLAVIDSDNSSFQIAVESIFPKTLRIKTGSGGVHNYFFIPNLKQKIILNLDDEDKTHLGEVQSYGTQVIGAGSLHPNGKYYEILEDNPIITIQCEELYEKLKPFMKKEIEKVEANAVYENFRTPETSEIDNLSVSDIWGTAGMKKQGQEYYGCHPIHDSTGGMNFWINPLKNMWHCFRCNSGGGVLSAIAVKEGIIDCSEAQRGSLRGDNAKKCIEIAKQKYGLKQTGTSIKDFVSNKQFYDGVQKNYETQPICYILDKDLKNYAEEEKSWIIDKLIPSKSVCVLTGKRGTMKSFISLLMTYCISSGNDFLNYQTEKGKVVYLDKENGIGVMKTRTQMLKKGMKFEDTEDVAFICFSQLKVDRPADIQAIEKLIQEYKPTLLIIDTYRRSVSYDENDAGEVSKLFVDTLRPLIEKYNFSILMIHHDRKGGNSSSHGKKDEDSGVDEMDEMRGSSDLPNYADIILKIERINPSSLLLKQLKNRNAGEEKPIKIKADFNEIEQSLNLTYDGEFIMRTKAEKCIEILTLWFAEKDIKHFTTKEAEAHAFKWGIKLSNFKNGMQEMLNRGFIERTNKGEYDVKI